MERAALMSRELKAHAVTTGGSMRTRGGVAAELGIADEHPSSVKTPFALLEEFRILRLPDVNPPKTGKSQRNYSVYLRTYSNFS